MTKQRKERIIKCFGQGTYSGIRDGYLAIVQHNKEGGVETVYTKKKLGDKPGVNWFYAHQYNPFMSVEYFK